MKIVGVLAFSLLIFSICCLACAKEISGGPHVVVIGIGQNSSGGPAPELDLVRTPSGVYNDPSRYSSPGKYNYTKPTSDNQTQTDMGTSMAISPFLFASIGTVNGTGNFSVWRSLGELDGVMAKQKSNGENGALDSDNRLLLSNEVELRSTLSRSNKSTVVISRDVVKFSGMSYRDTENFNSGSDRIANAFDVAGISKESNYFSKLSYSYSPEDYKEFYNQSLYNNSFIYNLGAVYNGTSSFNSKIGSGNRSEIFEEYRGTFALNRRLSNKETLDLNQTINESCIHCNIFNEEWTAGKRDSMNKGL